MGAGIFGLVLAVIPGAAFAVTDEIQVYTGDVAPVGTLGLTWHNNYTINGLKTPDYPGGLVDHHTYSSVTEWAYGVTPWFEAGLYLPLYSWSGNQGLTFNGFKLRALFVQPDNDQKEFYYGVNFDSAGTSGNGTARSTPARSAPSWAGILPTGGASPLIPSSIMATRAASPGWNSCPPPAWTTSSTIAGRLRRKNMTISASYAASCAGGTSFTSSGRWPTTPAIPFPSKRGPGSPHAGERQLCRQTDVHQRPDRTA